MRKNIFAQTSGLIFVLCVAQTFVYLTGCETIPKKRPPIAAPLTAQQQLQIAQRESLKEPNLAIQRLQGLIQNYPKSDVADNALILMGEIYYRRRDYQNAHLAFKQVIEDDVESAREGEAFIGAAKSLARAARHKESIEIAQRGLKYFSLDSQKSTRLELMKVVYFSFSETKQNLEALRALTQIIPLEQDQKLKQTHITRAKAIFNSRINESEDALIVSSADFGFLRGHAALRLALRAQRQGNLSEAKDLAEKSMALTEDAVVRDQALSIVKASEARTQVSPKTIGAVLPLTGRFARVGQRTLRGLQKGLGLVPGATSDFRLAVIDSEGHPDRARVAVERLFSEDQVIAVVGGLITRTAIAEAEKCAELGIPYVSLSQKADITALGPNVFNNSLNARLQVEFLVEKAMQSGINNFAILYPDDSYGQEYASLFWKSAERRGARITGAQMYASGETDFSAPIKKLVGTYDLSDRDVEYQHRLNEWKKKQKRIGPRTKIPKDLLPPIVDFQAIFVPDSLTALAQIAPSLAYHNVSNVKILGTNIWNNSSIEERKDRYFENVVFVDNLISVDPSFRSSTFVGQFKKQFGEEPGLFEAQANDSALILREIIVGGEKTRAGLIEELSRLNNFPGAMGRLSISENREVLRPLALLSVRQGKIVPTESLN